MLNLNSSQKYDVTKLYDDLNKDFKFLKSLFDQKTASDLAYLFLPENQPKAIDVNWTQMYDMHLTMRLNLSIAMSNAVSILEKHALLYLSNANEDSLNRLKTKVVDSGEL